MKLRSSRDEGPTEQGMTHAAAAPLERGLASPTRTSDLKGRSQNCNTREMVNKGGHADGTVPISSGNSEYIHRSLTWVKGKGHHPERARVLSLHDTPLSCFHFPNQIFTLTTGPHLFKEWSAEAISKETSF